MVRREIRDFIDWVIPAKYKTEVEWEDDEQDVYYEAEMIEEDILMQHLAEYKADASVVDLGLVDFYTQVCDAEQWDLDVIRERIKEVNSEIEEYRDKAWDDRNDDIEDAKTYYD
jgi:hypothetical protein